MKENKDKPKKFTARRILRISVNSFLYFLISLLVIFLIAFGFTQTSVFRDWLKDTVVEEVNGAMNGELSIDKIEGTIFTSIILKNTTLEQSGDTILTAEHIEVKTSPLKILFKIIYLRKIEIQNASIHLKEDSTGQLNISKLFPPKEEKEDTSSSEFPFAFQVADLNLRNINFALQEYAKLNSLETYESINMSDFRINDLNLRLSAFADMKSNSYQLSISEFSFFPNFKFFNLRSLEGELFATQSGVLVNQLNITTEESDLKINAGITDINLFGEFTDDELGSAPLRIEIESERFSFDDASTFVNALNVLKGKISLNLSAKGSINDLFIDNLSLNYNNTSLKLKGELINTLDTENLIARADLSGSIIDPEDPVKLFPSLDVPSYKDFGLITFNKLTLNGTTEEFGTEISLASDKGSEISGTAKINIRDDLPKYEINLQTKSLDLMAFSGMKTNLNSNIQLAGAGFSPTEMRADIDISATASYINDAYLDELKILTQAENGIIESKINLLLDTATTVNLNSNFNFSDANDPAYTVEITATDLNVGKLMGSVDMESALNFEMQAEGQGFNPDSMNLFLFMNLYDSFIYDFDIDSTALIVDVRRNDNGKKIINIVSDIADLTISGQYSITTLSDVITAEAELFQKSIFDKYSFLFPKEELADSELSTESKKLLQIENIALDYLVDFKDFLTISFNSTKIELDGSISGQLLAREDSIAFLSTLDINYFQYWNNSDLYFLTRTKFDVELLNRVQEGLIEDFSAFLFFRSNRLYAGSNFYDLGFKTRLTNDSVLIDFNSKFEDNLEFRLSSQLEVDDQLEQLIAVIDSVRISYNDLQIRNNEQIVIGYDNSNIDFKRFVLALSGGIFDLSGTLGFDDAGTLNIVANDIQWREIGREVLGIDDDSNFDSEISLNGTVNGTVSDFNLKMNLSLNDLIYQEKHLGTLTSEFSLADNELYTDIRFIDSLRTFESPKLTIFGTVPIDMSNEDNKNDSRSELNIKIISDNFDLSSLGNVVPFVDDLTGNFNTDIRITGNLDNPALNGSLNIKNSSFTAEQNNLRYNFETSVIFSREIIQIEKLQISNTIGTKYGGTLNGSGEVILDKFNVANANLKIRGDLKVLDKISREANPLVYGDLAIQTDGDINLTINDQSSFLDIPINVTVADLNFQLLQSAYQNTSGFIYRYPDIVDTLLLRNRELDSLIMLAEQTKQQESGEIQSAGFFDYRVSVNMKTEAKMVVVLSKELNQDLVAVMDGNFELTSREGRTTSTGQLNLLEGSKLSFIKSFDVTGDVRVEKLENPLLNIIATYRNYYYPTDTTGTAEEIEVAVKIKFNGPLSELAQNFIRDEENIAVYMGADKIENDEPDPTKSTTDAFLFIIAGRFTDGATTQEMNAAANTAASLAGSVLGGVLNRYLGDYVRNVQLRQVGSETKFNLIGRAGKFRYEIGGSTDVFQDLSRANVKIELPIIQRLLLRLERKEAINETTLSNDMFNELGLKYRFDF